MPNLHAVAIREVDEKWRLMRAAYHACHAAGIEPPVEVGRYFAYMDPEDIGAEHFAEFSLLPTRACKSYHHPPTGERGLVVELGELSEGITAIRFWVG